MLPVLATFFALGAQRAHWHRRRGSLLLVAGIALTGVVAVNDVQRLDVGGLKQLVEIGVTAGPYLAQQLLAELGKALGTDGFGLCPCGGLGGLVALGPRLGVVVDLGPKRGPRALEVAGAHRVNAAGRQRPAVRV